MDLKYILKVLIIVFLIFSLIIFINTIGLNLNVEQQPKKLLQVVTIEGLKNFVDEKEFVMDKNDAFCESQRGSSGSLEETCGKLTQNNCNLTSCCVWSSDNKCKAGDINGPTFNSDSNGKTKQLDYFYFKNNCYGEKCK